MLYISFFSNSSSFILCYVKQEHVNSRFACYCENLHVKRYFSRKIFQNIWKKLARTINLFLVTLQFKRKYLLLFKPRTLVFLFLEPEIRKTDLSTLFKLR